MAKSQKAFCRAALLRSKTAWERRCGNLHPRRRGRRPRLCSHARSTSVGAAISRPLCRMRDQGWRDVALRGGANIRRGANPRDVGDAVPYGCETVGFTVGAIHESPFGLPRTRVKALRKPPSPPQGPTSAVMQPCPIYVRRGGYQPPVMPDAGPGMAGRRGRRPLRGPTGRCKYQMWCVNCGRGKPLPYGRDRTGVRVRATAGGGSPRRAGRSRR